MTKWDYDYESRAALRCWDSPAYFYCMDPQMSYGRVCTCARSCTCTGWAGGWGGGGCRYWLCVHTCPISTQSVWQASVAITTPPQVAFLSHQPVSCVLSVGVFLSQHRRTTNSRSVVHCGGRRWAGNSANKSDKCFIDAQLSPHDFAMLNQNVQLILWKVNGKSLLKMSIIRSVVLW